MLTWFASNTLAAAALAALVLLVCRFRRLSPAVQHALWLLVLLRLLTPAWIAWPWSPLDLCPQLRLAETDLTGGAVAFPDPEAAADRMLEADPAGPPKSDHAPSQADALPSQSEGAPASTAPVASSALPQIADDPARGAPARQRVDARQEVRANQEVHAGQTAAPQSSFRLAWWPGAVLHLWAAGAALMLLLQVARGARFRRLLRHGEAPPQWFRDELSRLADRLGTRTPASLLVPELGCPVVWCLGRAKLLWPSALAERFEPGRTRGILLHELAHLRRRDHWVIWLEMAAACLWWWNPLFWYVRRRIHQCAEMACDAWVVWALPDGRRTYAESLIEIVEQMSQRAAVAPAWGAIGTTRRHFERRLTMILQPNVSRRLSWGGLAAIGLLALIALPGWSPAQVRQDEQPKKAASQPAAPAIADDTAAAAPATPQAAVETSRTPNPLQQQSQSQTPSGSGGRFQAKAIDVTWGEPQAIDVTSGEPADPAATPRKRTTHQPTHKTIEMFPMKHRDPASMVGIVGGLFQLLHGPKRVPSEEVTVLAVTDTLPTGARMQDYGSAIHLGFNWIDSAQATPARDLRLTVDNRTRALIARGSKEAVEKVAKLVAALDTPDPNVTGPIEKLGTLRVLPFRHRSAKDVIQVLAGLGIDVRVTYVQPGEDKALSPFFVAERGGLLIVTGPETDLKEIEGLIQSLDVEKKEPGAPRSESRTTGRRRSYGEDDGYEDYDEMYEEDYEGFDEPEEGRRGRRGGRGTRE